MILPSILGKSVTTEFGWLKHRATMSTRLLSSLTQTRMSFSIVISGLEIVLGHTSNLRYTQVGIRAIDYASNVRTFWHKRDLYDTLKTWSRWHQKAISDLAASAAALIRFCANVHLSTSIRHWPKDHVTRLSHLLVAWWWLRRFLAIVKALREDAHRKGSAKEEICFVERHGTAGSVHPTSNVTGDSVGFIGFSIPCTSSDTRSKTFDIFTPTSNRFNLYKTEMTVILSITVAVLNQPVLFRDNNDLAL